jgi:hypothetical protein
MSGMNGRPPGEVVAVPRGAGNMTARQNFAGNEIEMRGERASAAVAEQARAQVEARFIMARRFPRDEMRVREKLLLACRRPGFAEAAIYHKPIGDGVEGPSVRMAEEAARCMGNIATDMTTIYDDQHERVIQVSATDLEANLTYPVSITIEKTVERRKVKGGQVIRGQRVNSYGDTIYIVEATDDEILNKVNALASKALRTVLLRLVPGDILEEAMQTAYETRRNTDAQDPEQAKKRCCDAFSSIGVPVISLSEYLGHSMDVVTLDELDTLRGVYGAIKEGETTWQEVIEHARAKRAPVAEAAPEAGKAKGKPSLAEAAAKAKATRESAKKSTKPVDDDPMPDWANREPGQDG